MNEISPIGRTPGTTGANLHAARPAEGQSSPAPQADRIELSSNAEWLDRIHQMPEVRADLVAQVRADLAAGTYDADSKMDAILDNLLSDIA